jgi:hypothetical protein
MVKRASRSDESRTEVVTVRLTKAERTRLEFRASAAGLTVSAFASQLLNGGRVTVEAKAALNVPPELLAEFRRIGNNVNQIAYALNSRKAVPEGAVAKIFRDMVMALTQDLSLGVVVTPAVERAIQSVKQLRPQ